MAKCEVCGKGVTFGKKYSHSHIRTNRKWKPNIQRATVNIDGNNKQIYICTRCLRSTKMQNA